MDDKILEGTTTVGITCKDGVVFASERRASMGNLVAHKVAEKIFKIRSFSLPNEKQRCNQC